MEKITFINSVGQSVELGNDGPFILTKIEGMGAVNTNIHSSKSPSQDGETYVNNDLDIRNPSIEIMILADNIDKIFRHRRQLLSVFNPKLGLGTLLHEVNGVKRKIQAIPELAPVFPDAKNFKDCMQPALIQLYCPNPFWQDIKETETNLVSWIPNLEFIEGEGFYTEQSPNYWLETGDPFEEFQSQFGTGEGIEFGTREINQIVEIENTGDVDSPIKVVFRASGDVVNPYIQNMETKEMLRINKTLKQGDKLEITTGFGNKNIYLNGEKAHHYLDFLNSTWLQLNPGINLIKYDAEHGLNNLECIIYYTPQYLGV